jgi:O-methyltransferase
MLRRAVRKAKRITGVGQPSLIAQLIRRDVRSTTFFDAIEFINYERIEGDIVECGVFGGVSLALLAKGATFDPKGMSRQIVGIDSFDGLPTSADDHARWQPGDCATMHSPHPLLTVGERVTPETTRALFVLCELAPPVIHVGRFDAVLPTVVPSQHPKIALLHVDCDLYESTRDVLNGVAPALQDGTMVLFDDWFHYRGNPRRGEARAFSEFVSAHPEWVAVEWRTYGPFSKAFIFSRR